MKKNVRYAFALVLSCLTLNVAAKDSIVLKVHHFWPAAAMAPSKIMTPWCEKIEDESKGKLKCQFYPSMQLGGKPANLIDQAKDGVVDLAFTLPGYTAGRFPSMEVFELPFMSTSAEAGSKAAWEFYTKYGKDEFDAKGIKPLMFAVHDNAYIHTRTKQVKKVEDLKGLKMRAPTRLTTKLLISLSAAPVGLPLSQVPEALSKGVIDGYNLPWEVIPSFKLHEISKFHTETPPNSPALATSVFVFAMNKDRYDSLSDDLKAVIDKNSGFDFSAMAGRMWDASAAAGRQAAVDRGNVFYTIPDAEIQEWIDASGGLYDEWIASMEKSGAQANKWLKMLVI